MPPSGKMPVSIAATRTTSTTSLMSTRVSILAEYSIVKCGMFRTPAVSLAASSEVAAHRAVSSIVGLDRVAFAGLDRANKGTRQHHLSRLERQAIRRDLVGEPGHRGRGMVEYAGGKAGLFQLAVAKTECTDPAQIGFQRANWATAPFDPRVQDLQRGHYEIGGVEHVEHRAVGPGQPMLHHKGKFRFDACGDEAF